MPLCFAACLSNGVVDCCVEKTMRHVRAKVFDKKCFCFCMAHCFVL